MSDWLFDFDFEKVKRSVESGVITFPPGLSGSQRKEYILRIINTVQQEQSNSILNLRSSDE